MVYETLVSDLKKNNQMKNINIKFLACQKFSQIQLNE